MQILALCHTAVPDRIPEDPTSMRYRAESPDEAALVVAAKQFGFYFYKRTPTMLHVRETVSRNSNPVDQVYQLLKVLEFSSARKRMSVIVRFPNGRLLLLSKGADSVMLERVDKNKSGFVKETNKHLKDFGKVGLRTLVVAYKQLDEEEYTKWQAKYAEARATVGGERDLHTEELVDEIEQGLTIVGGTGVEDKLQEVVPEAMDRVARAGIKIWVWTGDKVETAINIGYACRCAKHFSLLFITSLLQTLFCISIFLLRFARFLGLFLRPKLPGYLVGWLCSLL
jgi:phospholipid-translocating ATPase